ncbi:MAG: hypothetical protein HYX74_09045 [Acidobacteria bacterium]|nr:hypothetical protein [Acidobacteriota bacterium]
MKPVKENSIAIAARETRLITRIFGPAGSGISCAPMSMPDRLKPVGLPNMRALLVRMDVQKRGIQRRRDDSKTNLSSNDAEHDRVIVLVFWSG